VATEPARGFAEQEYRDRLARAQKLMAEASLDALLLSTEAEVRYFTGFLTPFWQSPTRPWFVVVPASGKPVAVVPAIGAACMARTWLEDIRTWPSPAPDDEGVSLLAHTLSDLCGAKFRLGVPMGPETHLRMPLADWHRLQTLCPGLTIEDAQPLIRQLRTVKSPREIEKIGHICALVSGVFETLPSRMSVGMTEIDLFRLFRIACLEAGADEVPYLVGGAGAGGYEDIISPPTDRPIDTGDVLILDTGAVWDGYFCDFDRNWAFGRVDDAVRRAYDVCWTATEAGFAAARPGATCRELFGAMQTVLERGGARGAHAGRLGVGRLGHGFGMQLTEWPSHTARDDTVLEPGMVLTLEPGLAFAPGKMMVHEENIVIEADGARWLTRRAPRELPVIE
jgi:Xaa-Pro dipeptidase